MAKAVSDENLAEFKAYADEEYARRSAFRFVTIPEGATLLRDDSERLSGLSDEVRDNIYAQIFGHAPVLEAGAIFEDIKSLAGVVVVLNPFLYSDTGTGAGCMESGWLLCCYYDTNDACDISFYSPDARGLDGAHLTLNLISI